MKNKFQRFIKHIKTMFYTVLCVSLKEDKNLRENGKIGKFGNNFDKTFYMANKEEIGDLEKLSLLIIKIRNKNINILEFGEFRKLLTKLTIINDTEYNKLITELDFIDDSDIVDKLKNYLKEKKDEQLKIQAFIGSVSGATMSTQINFFNEYNNKKNEKNKPNNN